METAQKVKAADEEIKYLKNSIHRARLVDSEITVRCGYKGKNMPQLMDEKCCIIYQTYLPIHQN
jgi:hypothetical protein